MTDPNTRHAVCPECHAHQLTLPDGRLAEHPVTLNAAAARCPGSEDWPNRSAGNGTAYDETSQFASCPAATGEARCPDFPDGACRCRLARKHVTAAAPAHSCTCGSVWFSHSGTGGDLVNLIIRKSS